MRPVFVSHEFVCNIASQQAATCPILRGQYSIEDKMCIWEGKVGVFLQN